MKKQMILAMALAATAGALAQYVEPVEIEGVTVVPFYYSQKISHDGTQTAGEAEDGGTIYYNHTTGESYYYADCSYGRGYVISDDGRVVGSRLLDQEGQTSTAVIMAEGKIEAPDVFKGYTTSNIHSITPDGSRICGVVANPGRGMSNLPFYCDLDENGNLGELQFLPTPGKDFFNTMPQYCSATWISEDGKTIAGQVVQSRGILIYPIVYRQNEEGVWNYSCPSESLFNQAGLPIPEPIGDFDQEYPGLEVPEPTDFMDASKKALWNADYQLWESNNFADELDPYSHLPKYMTDEQIDEYVAAVEYYNEKFYDYSEKNEQYWADMFEIADSSVFFVRNGMAMSKDGKWLASSAQVELPPLDPYDEGGVYHYVPYLFNLETGEIEKISEMAESLVTNQVFADGSVMCATPAASAMPPRSWLYQNPMKRMISIEDYIKQVNNDYYEWLQENLSGDIPVAEDEYGGLKYEWATVTGQVSASDDLTTMFGGVMGYAIGMDMYVTYIFTGLPDLAGVEEIAAEPGFDGTYHIYNLTGVKVLTTKEASDILTLPKGIYIVNGKKVAV